MHNIGHEQTVNVPVAGGHKTYRLQRLTLGALRAFFGWVSDRAGDPFETVERYIGRVPDDVIKAEFKRACDMRDDLKFPSLTTATVQRAIATEEGMVQLFRQMLPSTTTEEEVWNLVSHLASQVKEKDGTSELIKVLARAQGGGSGGAAKNDVPTPGYAGET